MTGREGDGGGREGGKPRRACKMGMAYGRVSFGAQQMRLVSSLAASALQRGSLECSIWVRSSESSCRSTGRTRAGLRSETRPSTRTAPARTASASSARAMKRSCSQSACARCMSKHGGSARKMERRMSSSGSATPTSSTRCRICSVSCTRGRSCSAASRQHSAPPVPAASPPPPPPPSHASCSAAASMAEAVRAAASRTAVGASSKKGATQSRTKGSSSEHVPPAPTIRMDPRVCSASVS